MATENSHQTYDSFVVRVWRRAPAGSLVRAEVEHVQSGSVDVGRGPSWEWIRDRLTDRLDGAREPERELG